VTLDPEQATEDHLPDRAEGFLLALQVVEEPTHK